MHHLLLPRNTPPHTLNRRIGSPQSRLRHTGEEKIPLHDKKGVLNCELAVHFVMLKDGRVWWVSEGLERDVSDLFEGTVALLVWRDWGQ